MTVSTNRLTMSGSTTNALSYNTASITPSGKPLIVLVSINGYNHATCSGCNLTFTEKGFVEHYNNVGALTVLEGIGSSPTAGALTFYFGGESQTVCRWIVVELSGTDASSGSCVRQTSSGHAASDASGYTCPALLTFGSPNNAAVGCFANESGSGITLNPQGFFTEVGETGHYEDNNAMFEFRASQDTVVSATRTSAVGGISGIALEIILFAGSVSPSLSPSRSPSKSPSVSPSKSPSLSPSVSPSPSPRTPTHTEIDGSALDVATLKAYYKFESGALTTDSSGNSHTLTAVSDPAETTGEFGGGVILDGNDAYSAVDHADFKPSGIFTVSAWVKSTGAVGADVIFSSWSYPTRYAGWILYMSGNKARFLSGKNSGLVENTDWAYVTSDTSINDDAWHWVVGVYDGSYLRIYVDGHEDAAAVSWANAPAYEATNYVRVGCDNDTGTDTQFWDGSLDEVALWDGKALSASEVLSLWEIGSSSPSPSPSESPSVSPSLSPSLSPSISPSVSPSPSPGWENYTKGDYGVLPANNNDLENAYSGAEYVAVNTLNGVTTDQSATLEYAIHQFKDYVGLTAQTFTAMWTGQSNTNSFNSPTVLQIYNNTTNAWVTLDTNNTAGQNVNFTLTKEVTSLSDYVFADGTVSCRVYQLAV